MKSKAPKFSAKEATKTGSPSNRDMFDTTKAKKQLGKTTIRKKQRQSKETLIDARASTRDTIKKLAKKKAAQQMKGMGY